MGQILNTFILTLCPSSQPQPLPRPSLTLAVLPTLPNPVHEQIAYSTGLVILGPWARACWTHCLLGLDGLLPPLGNLGGVVVPDEHRRVWHRHNTGMLLPTARLNPG